MRKIKYLVALIILFLSVGFAAINTNLDITASTIVQQSEDFDVYFSDARVNGVQDITVVESATELKFTPEFSNGNYVLDYKVTNGSKNYDAEVEVNCNSNIKILNEFDTSTSLEAYESRDGKVTIENYPIGLEIIIADETFNVISSTEDTVTMLAQYNLDTTYRQSENANNVIFASTEGWEYEPGPKEIDIFTWSPNVTTYVNEYVSYLQEETGDISITGDLITLAELGTLRCTYPSDYAYSYVSYPSERTCASSEHASWLANGQSWWTRSAYAAGLSNAVWSVNASGVLVRSFCTNASAGVRPVITISKDALNAGSIINIAPVTCTIDATPVENYILGDGELPNALEKCKWEYTDLDNSGDISTGDEYTYCTESFNVISKTDTEVTMLAKYNLGINYRQSTSENRVKFSNTYGWEYTPGPKDIDIQQYDGPAKTYVNEYISYLQIETGDTTLSGNLLTFAELANLGCTYPSDYGYGKDSTERTCVNSQHFNWLINGQYWWVRSAVSVKEDNVWSVYGSGNIWLNPYHVAQGIRPTITISMDALNNIPYNPYKIGNEITIKNENSM